MSLFLSFFLSFFFFLSFLTQQSETPVKSTSYENCSVCLMMRLPQPSTTKNSSSSRAPSLAARRHRLQHSEHLVDEQCGTRQFSALSRRRRRTPGSQRVSRRCNCGRRVSTTTCTREPRTTCRSRDIDHLRVLQLWDLDGFLDDRQLWDRTVFSHWAP